MNVSEQLNKAADLIEKRGWAHGEGWHDDGSSPLCLEGAVFAASGFSRDDIVERGGDADDFIAACPAYAAVYSYLNGVQSAEEVEPYEWNDGLIFIRKNGFVAGWVGGSRDVAEQQAAAKVIEVLRAAALIEQARESERESAQVPA